MRRRIAIGIAALGLAVAAVALAAVANGESGARTITLQARSQLEQAHLVDNPPVGHSAGDVLIFTERLLDQGGRVIGHDAASCTFLFDDRSLCTATYTLQDGQVMVQLLQPRLSGAIIYTQPITGGTGRYARATGTVTVDQQPAGDHFTFDIHRPRGGDK
jgi:hypothetical protein